MKWDEAENRAALLELVVTGRLRRRVVQHEAFSHLSALSWTRHSGRRDEIMVDEAHRGDLQRLLTQVWPQWNSVAAELQSAGLPISIFGWRKLSDIHRMRSAAPFPSRLNRRTAMAQVAPHSKAGATARRRSALDAVGLTHDGIVRLRPSFGLQLERGDARYDASELASVLGEIVISERALIDGTQFAGRMPSAMLFIENLGAYLDFPPLPDWLIAHIPGWNTSTIRLLLSQLSRVPCVHFGDLDPNGVRILAHLREFRPDLRWFVPEFWREYIPKHALKAHWPDGFQTQDLPPIVQELASQGKWLEQEPIVLDSRIQAAILGASEKSRGRTHGGVTK